MQGPIGRINGQDQGYFTAVHNILSEFSSVLFETGLLAYLHKKLLGTTRLKDKKTFVNNSI